MGPNNVVGTPNVQNQPVAPSGADAVEQALASMPMESNPNTSPMGMTQKKSGKGMLYGMIIFAILAIGGISFGVWAMMDGNSKVANLEKQVTDLRAQNNKLLEQLAEYSVDNGDDDDNDEMVNDVLIDEWALKIKIGDNIKVLSIDLANKGDFEEAYIRAVSSDLADVIMNMDVSITGNIPGNYIIRSQQSTIKQPGVDIDLMPVYNDGEYNYFTYQPTGYVLEGLEQYTDQIVATFEEVFNYFKNSENYSNI